MRGEEQVRLIAVLLILVLVLAGCGRAVPFDAGTTILRISGSSSMAPVLSELADAYRRANPLVRIEVLGNGTAAGVRELRAGAVDIAAVSWQPEGQDLPDGLQAVPFARDGVAVIVHPSNRVSGLTLIQARSLYRGEIQDWQALGGPAVEPIITSREEGSGTRGAFEAAVMGNERVTSNALVLPNTQAVVEFVSRHPAAVGYVSMVALTDTVRALRVEDLLPTADNVRTGAYHLHRYLYLYAAAAPEPAGQRFLDYIAGSAGQAIIARRYVALR
jgi:phosphate transport system substrate-binding protein